MEHRGANPATCRHNIIAPNFDAGINEAFVECVSCDSKLSVEQLRGRRYDPDPTYGTWVYVPIGRVTKIRESEQGLAIEGEKFVADPLQVGRPIEIVNLGEAGFDEEQWSYRFGVERPQTREGAED